MLESRSFNDDERLGTIESQLKEATYVAEDADRKYDEVMKRMSYILACRNIHIFAPQYLPPSVPCHVQQCPVAPM